jgi:hypothetical protein
LILLSLLAEAMKFFPYLLIFAAGISVSTAACFYPPTTVPPPDEKERTVIPLPYDLAWDVVNNVIKRNDLHIDASEPTQRGIIEASGPRFTLQQADCGTVKSIAGAYAALPESNSTSVYNFLVKPHGRESTMVQVEVSYNSSVKVPFHPATDVDCISRGTDESRILNEIIAEARVTHRPEYYKSAPASPPRAESEGEPGATIRKHAASPPPEQEPEPQPEQPSQPRGPSLLPPLPPMHKFN